MRKSMWLLLLLILPGVMGANQKCYIFGTGNVCLNVTAISSSQGTIYFNQTNVTHDGNNYTYAQTVNQSGTTYTLYTYRNGISVPLTSSFTVNSSGGGGNGTVTATGGVANWPARFTNVSSTDLTILNLTCGTNGAFNSITNDSVCVTFVPATRNVNTGSGLTGGGALSSDLTLAVTAPTTNSTSCLGWSGTAFTSNTCNQTTGSGNISGGGTNTKIAKFTGTSTVGDSSLAEANGLVNVSANLTVFGNLTPSSNSTFDIGSDTKMWRHLYLANGSLYLGNRSVTGDTTYLYYQNVPLLSMNLAISDFLNKSDQRYNDSAAIGGVGSNVSSVNSSLTFLIFREEASLNFTNSTANSANISIEYLNSTKASSGQKNCTASLLENITINSSGVFGDCYVVAGSTDYNNYTVYFDVNFSSGAWTMAIGRNGMSALVGNLTDYFNSSDQRYNDSAAIGGVGSNVSSVNSSLTFLIFREEASLNFTNSTANGVNSSIGYLNNTKVPLFNITCTSGQIQNITTNSTVVTGQCYNSPGASNDGNNYTTAIEQNRSTDTVTTYLTRSGISGTISASFVDANDTNRVNTLNSTTIKLFNLTCASGQIQNITTNSTVVTADCYNSPSSAASGGNTSGKGSLAEMSFFSDRTNVTSNVNFSLNVNDGSVTLSNNFTLNESSFLINNYQVLRNYTMAPAPTTKEMIVTGAHNQTGYPIIYYRDNISGSYYFNQYDLLDTITTYCTPAGAVAPACIGGSMAQFGSGATWAGVTDIQSLGMGLRGTTAAQTLNAANLAGGSTTAAQVYVNAGFKSHHNYCFPSTSYGSGSTGSILAVGHTSLSIGVVASNLTIQDVPPSSQAVLFKFSTNASDSNWEVRTQTTTTITDTNTQMSFTAGDCYKFSFYAPKGGGVIYWNIRDYNKSTEQYGQLTTNLPTGTTGMQPIAGVRTLTTTARAITFQGMKIERIR